MNLRTKKAWIKKKSPFFAEFLQIFYFFGHTVKQPLPQPRCKAKASWGRNSAAQRRRLAVGMMASSKCIFCTHKQFALNIHLQQKRKKYNTQSTYSELWTFFVPKTAMKIDHVTTYYKAEFTCLTYGSVSTLRTTFL